MKKISYNEYVSDLYAIYVRSIVEYQSFEKFLEYAKMTDRFDLDLGYTRKEVEKIDEQT